jgi:hypothetical protein
MCKKEKNETCFNCIFNTYSAEDDTLFCNENGKLISDNELTDDEVCAKYRKRNCTPE